MKMAILSKHARHYQQIISSQLPDNVQIVDSTSNPAQLGNLGQIEILLGEPDLCAEVVADCSKLLWLQSTWAGVSPLINCPAQHYQLSGVKDLFGKQMREYVFAYLLHFSRQTDKFVMLQQQHLWQPVATDNLFGKTLGIAGVGSIGKDVAKLAKAFDMQVFGLTRQSRDCAEVDRYFALEQRYEFARLVDYLVMLLPDTANSKNLIDEKFIQSMQRHCVLINAGRAACLDHHSLVAALEQKKIKAAVLDVFDQEPLHQDSPLWSLDNVFITQHTSALSKVEEIAQLFMQNLNRILVGQPLVNAIDWQKGY